MQVLPCSVPLSQYFFPRKFRCHGTWLSSSIWPSDVPRSRSKMASTDLSSSGKPHVHRRVTLRQPLRCGFTIVLCSCLFFGAAQCRAQAAQDVAEAARQERARKEQAKKQKHVYTYEDFLPSKIPTPSATALLQPKRNHLPP